MPKIETILTTCPCGWPIRAEIHPAPLGARRVKQDRLFLFFAGADGIYRPGNRCPNCKRHFPLLSVDDFKRQLVQS